MGSGDAGVDPIGTGRQSDHGQAGARLHATARGHVQGVGFRMFVQREAQRLGCRGYVRNGSDGVSVEVVAEGTAKALERLLAAIHRGPRTAQVTDVEVSWQEPSGQWNGFLIQD